MADNVLLSHDLLHIINKRKAGNPSFVAVKINLNKAYDRIDWDFILKVLRAYGFPYNFLQWIHQCISMISFKILVNSNLSEILYPICGVRQGDPLSPYLFILCMNIYSRMLFLGESLHMFQGLKISRRSPSIS